MNYNVLKLLTIFIALISNLMSESVNVLKVIDGNTLYIKESIEFYGSDEESMSLSKKVASNIEGKHGAISLSCIYIEPHDPELYPDDQISSIGKQAFAYIRAQLSDPNKDWHFIADEEWKDENGLPYGYIIDAESGKILNVELIKKGYSCYYFKNGYSPKFHDQFWKAERIAFNNAVGIYSKDNDNLERRAYYFWERRKWAYSNWGSNPPSLKKERILIDKIGETPKTESVLIGVLVVILIIIFSGRNDYEKIANRTGLTGLIFNFMTWKLNPLKYVFKPITEKVEDKGIDLNWISKEELLKRRENKKENRKLEKLKKKVEKEEKKEQKKIKEEKLLYGSDELISMERKRQ